MSDEERDPAKRAAALLYEEDRWFDVDETASIIRDEYAKSQWRPIDTAPKDGTTVLFYLPESQLVGYYHIRHETWVTQTPVGQCFKYSPTHWQALAQPPREETL